MTATTEKACYLCGWCGESNDTGDGAYCKMCGADAYDFEQAEYDRCFLTTPEESLLQSFIAATVLMIALIAGSFIVLVGGQQ